MTKYAYTVELYRHIDQFVGPFDSWEKMMKNIGTLVLDDETGIGDTIQDEMLSGESPEDIVEWRHIRVYQIEEKELDSDDIYRRWQTEVAKHNKQMKEMMAKQQEDNDKREYERLKKKFEGQ